VLRVGLTGGLGSGKSTAARLFARHGAHILQADAIGHEMMRPGEPVYAAIVERFGPQVVSASGELDRSALARIAFAEGRVEELNSIVHPAVIARQAELADAIFSRDPNAIVIVESALIFETRHGGDEGWKNRFDCVVLVTASEEVKIERYVRRSGGDIVLSHERRAELEAEARRRLAQQIPDDQKAGMSDFVLVNNGPLIELEWQIDQLWPILQFASSAKTEQGPARYN
jgi:dephospho-CoA kinase